jgi:hypothetical protein
MTRVWAGTGARKTLPALAFAVAVCSCATTSEPKPEENVFPADYRASILQQLHRQLDDPTNIRDAYIAEPVVKTYAVTPRYVVCLRFNAKDRSGQYQGSKDLAAVYYAGKITQIVDATPELCANSLYRQFPELEKLCREAVCKS